MRTWRVVEEAYEAVWVPVIPTFLPQTSGGRQRVNIWSRTNIAGQLETNDDGALDEALARSCVRYQSTLLHGPTLDMVTSCSECGRHRDVQWCRHCGCWHHSQCVGGNYRTRPPENNNLILVRNTTLGFRWENGFTSSHISAGDGSVLGANTSYATSTWAMHQPGGPMVTGQLMIHRKDITSTRCEVHALAAGLVSSGDDGEQVRYNQSAIRIFIKARELANDKLRHIKFSDPHRIERRSLCPHMQTRGSMTPVWVRSHQENLPSNDSLLQPRRQSLPAETQLPVSRMVSMGWKLTPTGSRLMHSSCSMKRATSCSEPRRSIYENAHTWTCARNGFVGNIGMTNNTTQCKNMGWK
ncbi:unnamed protein product [Phytophthora fragariaefolia]|uniref:Unnamed protein product n=1 Tax=Phytophthora fragariaefolia TaxID=1490495 RepID=A0A9W6WVT4_9STRA|nr:unnamed protein product [Phytophthora fragariaefolia]